MTNQKRNYSAIVVPTRDNIDKLMMDSVGEQKFFAAGNLEVLKEKYKYIDRIEENLQRMDDKIQRILLDI